MATLARPASAGVIGEYRPPARISLAAAPGAAITLQTLSKPKATIFKA
jgi:hypothetical protein